MHVGGGFGPLQQVRLEGWRRQHRRKTGSGLGVGIAWSDFRTRPLLLYRVSLRQEECFGCGSDDERSAWLAPAGEIKEVRVLKEAGAYIAACTFRTAEKHDHGIGERLPQRGATLPVLIVRDARFRRQQRQR